MVQGHVRRASAQEQAELEREIATNTVHKTTWFPLDPNDDSFLELILSIADKGNTLVICSSPEGATEPWAKEI